MVSLFMVIPDCTLAGVSDVLESQECSAKVTRESGELVHGGSFSVKLFSFPFKGH